MTDPLRLAERALRTIQSDTPRLDRISDYIAGDHDQPYVPDNATSEEFKRILKRSITNWIPTLIAAPAQAMYVDSFRRSTKDEAGDEVAAEMSPEMEHWQRSRLDARQLAVHRTAIAYGAAYTLTYRNDKGESVTKGLPPRRTVTLYDDPATDLEPVCGIYVERWEGGVVSGDSADYDSARPGVVWFYDQSHQYRFLLKGGQLRYDGQPIPHGMTSCPITRHAPWLDMDGNAVGLVEALISPQDRFNQTVCDLLLAQSYTAAQLRYFIGVKPPMRMKLDSNTGELRPELDDEGRPIIDETRMNASRLTYTENPDAKIGAVPGGELGGLLSSAETTLKHLSGLSNVPPHFLMGQIANVSAEALQAAMTALLRMVDEIQHAIGESWERVFRLAMELDGNKTAAQDVTGEVLWKDVGGDNIAQHGDALAKLADIGVPKKGLWRRVPGVTELEFREWSKLDAEERSQSPDQQAVDQVFGSGVGARLAPSPAPTDNPPPTPGRRPFRNAI